MINRKSLSSILAVVFICGLVLAPVSAQTTTLAGLTAAQAAALAAAQGGTSDQSVSAQSPVVNELSVNKAGADAKGSVSTTPISQTPQIQFSIVERMYAATGVGEGDQLTQYGYSLFSGASAPSLASVGDDYVLGPQDKLVLYLWGDPVDIKELQPSYELSVDRAGNIFFAPVGQIAVWGQDLGTFRTLLKAQLDRRYKKLSISVVLGKLREFPVSVAGFAGEPGTVMATGADTLVSVLSRAGGIMKTGSLRSVRLTRAGKSKQESVTVDFYDVLIKGKTLDLRVREGDSVFVPGIGPVAGLAGEIRRPGIYELNGEKTIAELVSLAGGLLPSARSSSASVVRYAGDQKKLIAGDLSTPTFAATPFADGDLVLVGKVNSLVANAIEVTGAVKFPGRYTVESYASLKDLLSKVQVLPETNLYYGRVYRIDASGRDLSFTFSPKDILGGSADYPLRAQDIVVFYRYDYQPANPEADRFPATIVLSGPARYAGLYAWKPGTKLSSIVTKDQFLVGTSLEYAEIERRSVGGKAEYRTFSPRDVISGKYDIELSGRDVIRFVASEYLPAKPDFDKYPETVALYGPAKYKGLYAWKSGLKLGMLLKSAEVLLDANQYYAEIVRPLGGGKNEYLTFAPREVLAGTFDMELRSSDSVKLVSYASKSGGMTRSGAEVAPPATGNGTVMAAGTAGVEAATGQGNSLPSGVTVGGTQANVVGATAASVPGTAAGTTVSAAMGTAPTSAAQNQTEVTSQESVEAQFLEAVSVMGPVRYQGVYARTPNLKLSDVVTADQILQTTNTMYAELTRYLGDGKYEYYAFSPKDVLEKRYDMALAAQDMIRYVTVGYLPAKPDFDRFASAVAVYGPVKAAGLYAWKQGQTLSGLVKYAELVQETNRYYAELKRPIGGGKYEYKTFAPRDVVAGTFELELRASDTVTFYPAGYNPEKPDFERYSEALLVAGSVKYPGLYAKTPGMKLSSLVTKDWFLTTTNTAYGELVRFVKEGVYEYRTFNPSDLIEGKQDFELNGRDVIHFVASEYLPAKPDFDKYPETVALYGPAKYKGLYAWKSGLKLGMLLKSAEVLLDANQYYAEIVRPLGGGKNEYLTFAPREVLAGTFDMELRSSDSVKLVSYASKSGGMTRSGAEVAPPATGNGTVMTAGTAGVEAATGQGNSLPSGVTVGGTQGNVTGTSAAVASVPGTAAGTTVAATMGAAPTSAAQNQTEVTSQEGVEAQFLEAVSVMGPVRYQGVYARTPNLKLSDVVTADQILQTTNTMYAELTRYLGDGKYEYYAFSPKDVLEKRYDMALAAQDMIRYVTVGYLPAKPDFNTYRNFILVTGPVRRPGVYAFSSGMKLSSFVRTEDLLLETNKRYAELTRKNSDGSEKYYSFDPTDIATGKKDMNLTERDQIRFVASEYLPVKPDFDKYPETVALYGPAKYKGLYAWKSGLKLGMLLKSAEVLLDANQYYAEIVRPLGGGKNEYLTFAPREVLAGTFDMELRSSDSVKLVSYASKSGGMTRSGAEVAPPATGNGTVMAAGTAGVEAATGQGNSLPSGVTVGGTQANVVGATAASVPGTAAGTTVSAAMGTAPTSAAQNQTEVTSQESVEAQFLEAVSVMGPVRYQGVYARTPNLKLSDVVTADQILQTTNTMYAELTRYLGDGKYEYYAFSPKDVLEKRYDMALAAQDMIRYVTVGYLPAKPDFDRFASAVAVYGPVKAAGLYAWKQGQTLSGLVKYAELVQETNRYYAELKRPIGGGKYEYKTFAPRDVVAGTFELELRASDTVTFYPAGYNPEKPDFERYSEALLVAGSVKYPGLYAKTPGMKLSSLVTKDWFLTTTNTAYGELVRFVKEGVYEYRTFNPSDLIEGKQDFELNGRDVIHFVASEYLPAKPDFDKYPETVALYGPAKYKGLYAWKSGLKLGMLLKSAEVLLDANQYYAEIVRPLGGGKNEYLTFAPREVLAGTFDMELRSSDSVKLVSYASKSGGMTRSGAEVAPPATGNGTVMTAGTAGVEAATGQGNSLPSGVTVGGTQGNVTGTSAAVASVPGTAAGTTVAATMGAAPTSAAQNQTEVTSQEGVEAQFLEAVSVMGPVRYQGVYARTPNLKLSDVVTADQILQTTNTMYAELTRYLGDGKYEYYAFSPKDVLEKRYDMALAAQDMIRYVTVGYLPAKPDFNTYRNFILVTGPVRRPGVYAFSSGMKLSSFVRTEDLLLETNKRYAELTRKNSDGSEKYYSFDPTDIATGKKDMNLTERDQIRFVASEYLPVKPDFDKYPETVALYGPAKYKGLYAWKSGLKLGMLLKSAEVLLDANQYYAEIVRPLGGGKNEYLTFAPREVLAGTFDMELRSSDSVKLVSYASKSGGMTRSGAEVAPPATGNGTVMAAGTAGVEAATGQGNSLPSGVTVGGTQANVVGATAASVPGTAAGTTVSAAMGTAPTSAAQNQTEVTSQESVEAQFLEAVSVMGPVRYQGVYARTPNLKLSDVVTADQILQTTNTMYAELTRYLGDGKYEYYAFSPKDVLEKRYDMALAAQDMIRYVTVGYLPAKPDFDRFASAVAVYGPVKAAGLYAWKQGQTLSGLVKYAELVQETNRYYAELKRPIGGGKYEYKTFAPRDVVAGTFELELRASDTVTFYPAGYNPEKPDFEHYPEAIHVSGAVRYPGLYALSGNTMLSSILDAEVLRTDTNMAYAELKRYAGEGKYEYTAFAPGDVLARKFDVALSPRDSLRFISVDGPPPAPDFDLFPGSVSITGSVKNGGLYALRRGMKLSDLVKEAALRLDANIYYARFIKTQPGGRNEYRTFAPREVLAGTFDMVLTGSESIRILSISETRQPLGAERNVRTLGAPLVDNSGQVAVGVAPSQGNTIPAPATSAASTVVAAKIDEKSVLSPSAQVGVPAGQTQGSALAQTAVNPLPVQDAGKASEPVLTDIVTVEEDPEAKLYPQVVTVSGPVKYFGYYARTPGLKLSSILDKEQILPSTHTGYAELTRFVGDGRYEYLTFSPKDVLDGRFDLVLKDRDAIRFVPVGYLPTEPDFNHFDKAVALYGPIGNAGLYAWTPGAKLSSFVSSRFFQTETNLNYAEIERRLPGGRFEYLTFSPKAVVEGAMDVDLSARDVIRFVPAALKSSSVNKDRFSAVVTLDGSIDHAGPHAWREGLTLLDVVDPAYYRMDTNLDYAEIRRSTQAGDAIITFAPKNVWADGKAGGIRLQQRDAVYFFPKYYKAPVSISGEVLNPKVIPYFEGMTILDVLRAVEPASETRGLKAILNRADGKDVAVYLEDVLYRQTNSSIPLLPGDSITLQKLLPDERLPQIVVRGAVVKPQTLPWKQGMKLSEALKASGGYDVNAYPKGLVLIRKSAAYAQQLQVDRLISSLDAASQEAKTAAAAGSSLSALEGGATLVNLQLELITQKTQLAELKQLGKEGFGRLNLDLPPTIAELERSSEDVPIERDDTIFVPTTPSYVLAIGQVTQQSVLAYKKGMTVRDVIADSGWATHAADLGAISVLHSNGKLTNYAGKGFLFFRPNILDLTLEPGDAVLVPRETVKVNATWAYIKDSVTIIYQLVTATVSTLKILGF